MNTLDTTTTKIAIFHGKKGYVELSAKIRQLSKILNEVMTFRLRLSLFIVEKIELSTFCRQLKSVVKDFLKIKHFEFDVFKPSATCENFLHVQNQVG